MYHRTSPPVSGFFSLSMSPGMSLNRPWFTYNGSMEVEDHSDCNCINFCTAIHLLYVLLSPPSSAWSPPSPPVLGQPINTSTTSVWYNWQPFSVLPLSPSLRVPQPPKAIAALVTIRPIVCSSRKHMGQSNCCFFQRSLTSSHQSGE